MHGVSSAPVMNQQKYLYYANIYVSFILLLSMVDQSEEFTESVEPGERYQVIIRRISNRRNAIAEVNGAELNPGPLICPPGIEVEILTISEELAACLNQEVRIGNHRSGFSNFLDSRFPEPLST